MTERDGSKARYKYLIFFADWAIHPQKDRHHTVLDKLYTEIYKCTKMALSGQDIDENPIEELVNFNLLRKDLRAILTSYEIGDNIDDETWFLLAKTLHKILKDQPLVKPAAGIKYIQLTGSTSGSATFTVELFESIRRIGKDSVRYEESIFIYHFFWET